MPGLLKHIPELTWTEAKKHTHVATAYAALKKKYENNPQATIGLLYSANNNQALALHNTDHKYDSTIFSGGGGQALFFPALVKAIETDTKTDPAFKQQFKNAIRILPIATSLHGGDNTTKDSAGKPINAVTQALLDRDLKALQDHINAGNEVLGGGPDGDYSIGGGFSKGFYDKKFEPINGDSQSAYVQKCLKNLEKDPKQDFHPSVTLTDTQPTNYSADLNPDLKAVVAAFKLKFKEDPKLINGQITLSFKDKPCAVDFFKGQADAKKAFDMVCKETDHRIYSDGKGIMVQGSIKDVGEYKTNPEHFSRNDDGSLLRKSPESAITPVAPVALAAVPDAAAPDAAAVTPKGP